LPQQTRNKALEKILTGRKNTNILSSFFLQDAAHEPPLLLALLPALNPEFRMFGTGQDGIFETQKNNLWQKIFLRS
jgi:hypothetical protein